MKFTNTIEVVAGVERTTAKGQWAIGDAIVQDFERRFEL